MSGAKIMLILSGTEPSTRRIASAGRWAVWQRKWASMAMIEHLALGPVRVIGPDDPRMAIASNQTCRLGYSCCCSVHCRTYTYNVLLAIIVPLRHQLIRETVGNTRLSGRGRLIAAGQGRIRRGHSFAKRGELLDEHLAAGRCCGVMVLSFEGKHYRFRDVYRASRGGRADALV